MSDMMVHSDIQFENLLWSFFTNNNEEKDIKTRIYIFEELSQPNAIISNSQFTDEVFGQFEKRRRRIKNNFI